MTTSGTIFDIKRFAIHDGPGIRTTVFFSGCPFGCWWCHNPEALKPEESARKVTPEEVLAEVVRDKVFYEQTGGGVTFSGGEPLYQPDFLGELLEMCRREKLHTALDTTGHAETGVLDKVAGMVDLFLYDLKLMDDGEHRKYTGESNALLLKNLEVLAGGKAAINVRIPLVPGITDTQSNIGAMLDFLGGLKRVDRVSILPYHRSAAGKYEKMQLENKMTGTRTPSREIIEKVRLRFEEKGFAVGVGG